jgi:hypothetical protein
MITKEFKERLSDILEDVITDYFKDDECDYTSRAINNICALIEEYKETIYID